MGKTMRVLLALILFQGLALAQQPPTNSYGLDLAANNSLGVSASGRARVKYNSSTGTLQLSANGGSYVSIPTSLATAYAAAASTADNVLDLVVGKGPVKLSYAGLVDDFVQASGLEVVNPTAADGTNVWRDSPSIVLSGAFWRPSSSTSQAIRIQMGAGYGFDGGPALIVRQRDPSGSEVNVDLLQVFRSSAAMTAFDCGGSFQFNEDVFFTGHLRARNAGTQDLGNASVPWANVYAAVVMNQGGDIRLGSATGGSSVHITGGFTTGGVGHLVPDVAADTFALLAASQTFTNKTLTAPVLSGSITGTYTLAGTPTITSPAISSPTLSGTTAGTYSIGGTPTLSANLSIASGIDIVAAGGVSDVDWSLSSGFWKGPTGTNTHGGLTVVAPSASTSGSPTLFTVTGPAHTTLAASTEATDAYFNLARTVQFSTGALATQRAFMISAPTYGFSGASVISDAATLYVDRAPQAGTNATITRGYSAWFAAGQVRVDASIRGALAGNVIDLSGSNLTLTGNGGSVFITGGSGFKPLAQGSQDNGAATLEWNSIWADEHLSRNEALSWSTATPTAITYASGEQKTITLSTNVTAWSLTAGTGPAQRIVLVFVQDGTGSRTLAGAGSTIKLASALTLSTGAGKRDTLVLQWDGVNWVELNRSLNN